MSISAILFVMIVILSGSCVQSALGFGTTMITMGFLPLIMEYSKAMGLSIVMVTLRQIQRFDPVGCHAAFSDPHGNHLRYCKSSVC